MISKNPDKILLGELDKYRKETNSIFYALSRHLITLAALSLTISPAFISQITSDISIIALYIFSLAGALISIFCGVAQYYRDYKQFSEYTKYLSIVTYKEENHRSVSERKIIDKYVKQYEKEATFNTGLSWLLAQLITMLASLTLLLFTIIYSYI